MHTGQNNSSSLTGGTIGEKFLISNHKCNTFLNTYKKKYDEIVF